MGFRKFQGERGPIGSIIYRSKRGLVHVINFVLINVYPLSVATKRNMIPCHTNAINALKAYEAATNASCLYTSRLTL